MASGRRVSHELLWGGAEYQESCLMDRIQVGMTTVLSPCTRDLPTRTSRAPLLPELSRMTLSRGVTHCDARGREFAGPIVEDMKSQGTVLISTSTSTTHRIRIHVTKYQPYL